MKPVAVRSFVPGVNEWGQERKNGYTDRTVDMVVKIYSQNYVSDIRYNDVELIGLTYDQDITDSNQIIINNLKYNILHVIPSGRILQVLMKREY